MRVRTFHFAVASTFICSVLLEKNKKANYGCCKIIPLESEYVPANVGIIIIIISVVDVGKPQFLRGH